MDVFDLQLSDDELGRELSRVYQQDLVIRSYELELPSNVMNRRLAKASVVIQTSSGVKTLEILIKECSPHELTVLGIANKLLPYSSPKVVLYKSQGKVLWVVLENIDKWVDIGGPGRVNENIVDGLFTIHRTFLGETEPLLANFSTFPVAAESTLKSGVIRALADIEEIRTDRIVADLFEDWVAVRACIDTRLNSPIKFDFPMTLLHGSYYPNTVRGISRADTGGLYVVAYDWQYSAIGWPQIDLALLLDRLDIIARHQGLEGPSPVLLDRYWLQLHENFPELDYMQFCDLYEFCYICRVIPVVRWWLKSFMAHPSRDPARPVLEIKVKFERLKGEHGQKET